MNDKNLIEELRQKHEEYGVLQIRFAVACGIGELTLIQINNGKVISSYELKLNIIKQIECFNPREPLFFW